MGLACFRGAARLILDGSQSLSVEQVVGADSYLYHAYAPEPIVLETIRKGTSKGNGAN